MFLWILTTVLYRASLYEFIHGISVYDFYQILPRQIEISLNAFKIDVQVDLLKVMHKASMHDFKHWSSI